MPLYEFITITGAASTTTANTLESDADAVHVGDQRNDRRHRRRLQDDEDRQAEPFDGAGQSHRDAETDADDTGKRDADDQRLER